MASCSACKRTFTCGMRETSEPCWCASYPALAHIIPEADCLCPECLRARIAVETDSGAADRTRAGLGDSPQIGKALAGALAAFLVATLAVAPVDTLAVPPAQEAIMKACDEAETASQCERVLEREQLKQFPGLASREGTALRIQTRPGSPPIELRDSGNPEDDDSDFKWHSLWDYWPASKIAIVSVTTKTTDHFLVVQLDRGMQVRVPAEPILSPDGQRFFVPDFCDSGCGNQIQVWKIDRTRAFREKTWRPRERWYQPDIEWRDASSLAVEYSVAGPRRRLADPGEPNLVKAEPLVIKLSDWAWIADAPAR